MTLNELSKEIHKNAVEHGWWDDERSFGEIIALCHSELSEALEEFRNDMPMLYYNCIETEYKHKCDPKDEYDCSNYGIEDCPYKDKKPEGIAVELADCIIRILDFCGKENIDIDEVIRIKHEYNKTRDYKHGSKRI